MPLGLRMSLDPLQVRIIGLLKHRRSRHSFVGGSSVFNETYPRMSDDLDIYAEDVAIPTIAEADLACLASGGLRISERFDHYGLAIEAIVSDGISKSLIEWSEADRERFFPVQPHATFGWALHKSDLAVQKLIAAATRHKARDSYDLTLIDERYMGLSIAALAAPAKLKGISPIAILERARAIAMGIPTDDFDLIRRDGAEQALSAGAIKLDFADRVERAINEIVGSCSGAVAGLLYVNASSGQHEFPTCETIGTLVAHKATPRGAIPVFAALRATERG